MDYAFDPRALRPSETGRSGPTISDLIGNVPPNDRGQYERLMQYLTQPRHDAGPDARRAEAGMYAGPREADQNPSGMQQPGAVMRLMAHLFGGGQ
jgi:hypothetical protein